jgi:hypothetical protein
MLGGTLALAIGATLMYVSTTSSSTTALLNDE